MSLRAGWLQTSEGGPWDSPCTDAARVVNEAMTADRGDMGR